MHGKAHNSNRSKDEILKEVRGSVGEAAAVLKSLGADYERVAWVLEDTLTSLDEIEMSKTVTPPGDVGERTVEEMFEKLAKLCSS